MQEVMVTQRELDAVDAGIQYWIEVAVGDRVRGTTGSPLCQAFGAGDDCSECPVKLVTGMLCFLNSAQHAPAQGGGDDLGKRAGAYVDFLKEVKWHCHLPLMDQLPKLAEAATSMARATKASMISFASIAKLFEQLGPHPLKEAVEVEAKASPQRSHYVTREVYDAVRESISGRWTNLCRGEYGDPCLVCEAVGKGCDNCPLEMDGQGCGEGSWYMEWSDASAEYSRDSKQAMAAAERMRTYLVDLLGRLVVKEEPEKGRRWVKVRVSAELMAQWLTMGTQACTAAGLPKDAKLVECGWCGMPEEVLLYFEHPSFAPHYVAPEVVPVFTALQEPEVDAVPMVKAWVLGGIGSYKDDAYGAAFSYSADGARQMFRAQGFTEVDDRPVVEVRLPKYLNDYSKGGE